MEWGKNYDAAHENTDRCHDLVGVKMKVAIHQSIEFVDGRTKPVFGPISEHSKQNTSRYFPASGAPPVLTSSSNKKRRSSYSHVHAPPTKQSKTISILEPHSLAYCSTPRHEYNQLQYSSTPEQSAPDNSGDLLPARDQVSSLHQKKSPRYTHLSDFDNDVETECFASVDFVSSHAR